MNNVNLPPDIRNFAGVPVLVTGFPGFISLHLIERLKEAGAFIFAFKKPFSEISLLENRLPGNSIKVFDVDITDYKSLQSAIKKIHPQIIFHLAAYTDADRSSDILDRCIKVNTSGTANLLRALKQNKFKSFVNVSSTEVYGPVPVPFKESQPTAPISPYGISKLAAENICNFFHEIYKLPIINLRLSLIYGEFQPASKIIPYIILSCLKKRDLQLTTGEQTKDFIYTGDVVDALLLAALEGKAIGKTFNIGTGQEISIKKLVEKIIKLIKISGSIHFGPVPMKKGEIMRMRVSIAKAKKILGWEPKISLDEGLEKVASWYARKQLKYYKKTSLKPLVIPI